MCANPFSMHTNTIPTHQTDFGDQKRPSGQMPPPPRKLPYECFPWGGGLNKQNSLFRTKNRHSGLRRIAIDLIPFANVRECVCRHFDILFTEF